MTFQISQRNETNLGSEKKVGEYLETELEKSGFKVTLPTNADWGYVFRIKFGNNLFDIIIRPLSETEMSVSINLVRRLFGTLFSKKRAKEKKTLEGIVEDLCKKYRI